MTLVRCLALLFFVCAPALGQEPDLDKIAMSARWLKLGHYQSSWFHSGRQSQIDSGRFFLAANGKSDPYQELLTTIQRFKQEQSSGEFTVSCQYPARFYWLNEQLSANWRAPVCPELERWQTIIDPAGVTLVFPTAFMNNPSSMFGHTLLRVDAVDQTRHKELIAFAINFAAQPDTADNAMLYAYKGFVGKYPSAFSLMPYYIKVKEYNDLESRDMWEYKLNLSADEVRFLLYHLWELQDARFEYYFADENCSYQLLSLIQVVRDDLHLTDEFPFHAVPSDTVHVLDRLGLIHRPMYRASIGTRLNHYASELEPLELEQALELAQGHQTAKAITDPQQVARLEMAYEWLNFTFYDERLARETTAPLLKSLLAERSQYPIPSPFSPLSTPNDSPEQGHGSMRIGAGLASEGHSKFATLQWRGIYHDLLDRPAGFIPGAQINFLDIELGLHSNGNLKLQHLYLLDAMSLAPDNQLFDSWSWNVRLGSDRQPAQQEWQNRWFVQSGYGKSWGDPMASHAYLLASFELNSAPEMADSFSAGVGIEAGWLITQTHQDRWQLSAQWMAQTESSLHTRSALSLKWNKVLNKDWAVRTTLSHQQWQAEEQALSISLLHYF